MQLAEKEWAMKTATNDNMERGSMLHMETHQHKHTHTYTQTQEGHTKTQASQGPTCAVLQAPHNTALSAYEAPDQLAGDLKLHQSGSVALPIP